MRILLKHQFTICVIILLILHAPTKKASFPNPVVTRNKCVGGGGEYDVQIYEIGVNFHHLIKLSWCRYHQLYDRMAATQIHKPRFSASECGKFHIHANVERNSIIIIHSCGFVWRWMVKKPSCFPRKKEKNGMLELFFFYLSFISCIIQYYSNWSQRNWVHTTTTEVI